MSARLPSAALLPIPGVLWGSYPERQRAVAAPVLLPWFCERRYRHKVTAVRAAATAWTRLSEMEREASLAELRADLRRDGLQGAAAVAALGCVLERAYASLGIELFDTQLFASAALLDGHLAEMATGEGKTHAAAAASAVAALAGVPVHVITANEYLAARDTEALRPLYGSLGLSVGTILSSQPAEERRAVYACDIVYCTGRELVFDYLRDRQALGASRADLSRRASALTGRTLTAPLLRGLCMAVVDEADSVLIDEATVPLVLSEAVGDSARRAFLWQALTLARALEPDEHFELDPEARSATLTSSGRQNVADAASTLEGSWQSERRRNEAICTALAALHLFRADHDYLVRDGRVEIIDATTGRAAPGRVWSRGLHAFIEMKENCAVTADTRTVAQITYQRFFPRYVRLCGMSGTLAEASRELARSYGLRIVRVPLRKRNRRVRLPTRVFASTAQRWHAAAERAASLSRTGRPVLIGTDSVAASEALSESLSERGIAHAVLNARQDREEAAIIAGAGVAGTVTVATNMAGRGTDIAIDARARDAGGLHVICCQHNGARRLDRQLAGRAARQGDPGSVEMWFALDAGLFSRWRPFIAAMPAWMVSITARAWFVLLKRISEWQDAARRRELVRQDAEWGRRATFAPPVE